MGRVRFRGRDRVRSIFLDNNFDPGSTKDVDPRSMSCLAKSQWPEKNHGKGNVTHIKIKIGAYMVTDNENLEIMCWNAGDVRAQAGPPLILVTDWPYPWVPKCGCLVWGSFWKSKLPGAAEPHWLSRWSYMPRAIARPLDAQSTWGCFAWGLWSYTS